MNTFCKSIFIAVALLCTTFSVRAQSTVTAALERYLVANGQMSQVAQNLAPNLEKIIPLMNIKVPAGYTEETLVEKYVSENMTRDIASAMAPTLMELNLSPAKLNVLSALLESEEGKLATQHALYMNSEEVMQDFMAFLYNGGVEIAQGKTPKDYVSKATPSRARLFSAYYDISGIDSYLEAFLHVLLSSQEQEIPADTQEKMILFLSKNMKPLMLDLSDGILSDRDLEFYAKVYSYPQYEQITQAIKNIMADAESFGMAIFSRFADWVETVK